ncbi:MAG: NAD(P)/FAD-dependent oxidoreductase, partial [Ruegeria sp.]
TDTVKANIVIGADGRNSAVAQAANARSIMQCKTTTANVYAYVNDVPNEGYRWYYGPGVAAGLIPTTSNSHCLFAICRPADFSAIFADGAYDGALQMLSKWEPDIAADLAIRGPAERARRFLGHQGYLRDCAGPGWALVGDAGYFKDPVTAHGITDAFLDAHRLSQAFARTPGNQGAYQQQRDKHAVEFLKITEEIATLDWDFDTLKALHTDLNACMKAEAKDIGHQDVKSPMPAFAQG